MYFRCVLFIIKRLLPKVKFWKNCRWNKRREENTLAWRTTTCPLDQDDHNDYDEYFSRNGQREAGYIQRNRGICRKHVDNTRRSRPQDGSNYSFCGVYVYEHYSSNMQFNTIISSEVFLLLFNKLRSLLTIGVYDV